MNETGSAEKIAMVDNPSEKHLELYRAVMEVDSINHHLDYLMARLSNAGTDAKLRGEGDAAPSFMTVLTDSPAHLREMTVSAHKRIDQIAEMLFN